MRRRPLPHPHRPLPHARWVLESPRAPRLRCVRPLQRARPRATCGRRTRRTRRALGEGLRDRAMRHATNRIADGARYARGSTELGCRRTDYRACRSRSDLPSAARAVVRLRLLARAPRGVRVLRADDATARVARERLFDAATCAVDCVASRSVRFGCQFVSPENARDPGIEGLSFSMNRAAPQGGSYKNVAPVVAWVMTTSSYRPS